MIQGISTLGISNLVVVFFVVTLFYIVCVAISENGGYRANKTAGLATATALLGVGVVVSLGIYGHALGDITDKIDNVAIVVDAFPSKIADCANKTQVGNLFNHYGIQRTAKIAGTVMQTYEAIVLALLLSFTLIAATLFWMASLEWFSAFWRWRFYWFGMYWVLSLEIVCLIVSLFYDIVADAQMVMKDADGVVGQALTSCTEIWEFLSLFLIDTSPACQTQVRREMCVVHNTLTSFVNDNLNLFYGSSVATAFIPPLLTLMLGLVVFFTWSNDRTKPPPKPVLKSTKRVTFQPNDYDSTVAW